MKTTTRGLLSVAAACLTVPAFSQNVGAEYSLEIERQPLAAALTDFSRVTGLQIGYFPRSPTENIYIGPLKGRYTAEMAIAQLLRPTGLSYERLNERTIAVTASDSMRSQHGGVSVMEQNIDTFMAPSFVRLANLPDERLTEEQDSRQTGSRESGDEKRFRGRREIEEVIVTAQKREERLQDVPISISVLTGDYLDSSTIRDVTEALSRVSGVAIGRDIQGDGMRVTVRGVAADGGGGASPAAYYLDSAPFGFVSIAFAPPADAYDLDRVEVLRGPQGTLYGASALNGVVRVLTRDADLDQFELKARGLSSNTEDGDWNYRGDMAVNMPIVEGKLAARAVLGYQDLSGWIDKPNQKDANDMQSRVARIKLNAQPTEQLSIGLSAWLSKTDLAGTAVANDERQRDYPGDEPISVDYEVYNLEVGYEFPGFSIKSMTSYLDYENEYTLGLGVLGPDSFVTLPVVYSAQTFAQEVAFSSTHDGPWRWTAGAMYRDSEEPVSWTLPPFIVNPVANTDFSESYAVFGELTRSFMDGRWDLTVGGRYFEDRMREVETGRASPPVPPDHLITRGETFHATTPRVILTLHPRQQLNFYASYSQGFRSGWPNAPTSPLPEVQPDKLTNYELGSKGSFLGGRMAFDVALYYIDWKDVQVSLRVPVPGSNVCCTSGGVNGESASGIGVDFGLTAKPIDALELGVNASWNDLTVDGPVFQPTVTAGPVLLLDKGDRLMGSAEYTLGTFAEYVFPVGASGYEGQFSVSANYTSKLSRRGILTDQRLILDGESSLIARTSFSIRAANHWTATLFVDNLTDEDPGMDRAEDNPTGDVFLRVRPRTIGMQVEYHY